MEVIQRRIDYRRPDSFYLYPFSDAHLGSVASAEPHLRMKIQECVKRGRLGLALGVGDWCDCITSKDKRWSNNGLAPWVERTNIIESQRRKAVELFGPLAEQGQLIGIGTGNHEEKIHIEHDNDICRNLCHDLNAPYAGYTCFVVLKFFRSGKFTHQLVIHSWHGAGSAQSEGARVMRLTRLVNDIEADIYLMGHLHAMSTHTPDRLVQRNGRVRSIKLASTITGCWLKTYAQPHNGEILDPSYGEEKGYKPSRIGMPIIRITPDNYNNPYENEFVIES